jgi:hypothetical protein
LIPDIKSLPGCGQDYLRSTPMVYFLRPSAALVLATG